MAIPNPYLMRVTKKDTGKHGREAEKRLAKRIGGTLTPGSGALSPVDKRQLREASDLGSAGKKAEVRTAKRLGGVLQVGSGCKDGAKGDILLSGSKVSLLIENKSTTKESFAVKLDQLLKIRQEALEVTKTPALAFQFVNSQGVPVKGGNWVCITEDFFTELLEAFNERFD